MGVFSSTVLGNSIPKAKNKLNILLITIDTLRADRLSCYGSQHPKTPYIDELAEKGVLFSKAFANTSTTLPSHANILLGVTPNYHGVHENLNFIVSKELLTLAEHLKDNGYATGAFVGAYPLDSRFGLSQGFDIYDDNYDRTHTENFTTLERNAEAVIISKKEGASGVIRSFQLSRWGIRFSIRAEKLSLSIISQLIDILSRTDTRWGDV